MAAPPFSLSTRSCRDSALLPSLVSSTTSDVSPSPRHRRPPPSTGRPPQLSLPPPQPVCFMKLSAKRAHSPSRARKQRDSGSPRPREGLPLRDLLRLSFSLTRSHPLLDHHGLKSIGQGFLSLFLN